MMSNSYEEQSVKLFTRQALVPFYILFTISIDLLQCQLDRSCDKNEYFGPKCKYRNLRIHAKGVYLKSRGQKFVNGTTCINVKPQEKVTVYVRPIQIGWIRIYLKDASTAHEVNVSLQDENGQDTPCKDKERYLWQNVIDIYCKPGLLIRAIIIEGGELNTTCDIDISGGRYLSKDGALQMSSTFESHVGAKCVDENNNTFCQTKSEKNATVWIDLKTPANFFQYIITTTERTEKRLSDSVIILLDKTFKEADRTEILQKKEVYDSMMYSVPRPIRVFEISKSSSRQNTLSFFEIQLYGETVCQNSTFGLTCDKHCNCFRKDENCFHITGLCPGGCAPGFRGIDCQKPCAANTYGLNCSKTCSKRCLGGCNRVNGACSKCTAGFRGSKCETPCANGTYGMNCRQKCSHCLCDTVDGTCKDCHPGWLGQTCDRACPQGTWGQNCSRACSSNCAGSGKCKNDNGECVQGCTAGYQLPDCTIHSPKKKSPAEGHLLLNTSMGICIIVLISVILALFCFLLRKQPSREHEGEE